MVSQYLFQCYSGTAQAHRSAMRYNIKFIDCDAARFKTAGKVIVAELLFAEIEFTIRAIALRCGSSRSPRAHS